MKTKHTVIYTSIIAALTCYPAAASMLDYINPVDPATTSNQYSTDDILIPKKAKLTQNAIHNHYAIGMQRFMQSNVKSAYMDFKIMIETIQNHTFLPSLT